LGRSVFLFFCGGGLTQAKNRAAQATQKQVPVARSPPTPRISIEPPGRRSRRANPRGGWGFGAGLLIGSSWSLKKKKVLSTQTSVKQFIRRVHRPVLFVGSAAAPRLLFCFCFPLFFGNLLLIALWLRWATSFFWSHTGPWPGRRTRRSRYFFPFSFLVRMAVAVGRPGSTAFGYSHWWGGGGLRPGPACVRLLPLAGRKKMFVSQRQRHHIKGPP
jgi:hypothetical protein